MMKTPVDPSSLLKPLVSEDLVLGIAPPLSAGLFGLQCSPEDSALVVVPVPWEATASYGRGTSLTPGRVIGVSHQMDLEDLAFGRPYLKGIAMAPEDPDLLLWNEEGKALVSAIRKGSLNREILVSRVNELSTRVSRRVKEHAQKWLRLGKKVGLLGGDHSSPYGLFQALGEVHSQFGILHIDAHMDLRESYEGFVGSHASIFYETLKFPYVQALVQVGIRDFSAPEKAFAESRGVHVFYDRDLHRASARGETFDKISQRILQKLPEKVYVSFDIDGLDPRFCPHTGTPVPGGLDYREAVYLLEELVSSGRQVIGFDLCEVGGAGEFDLNVGARLLYKLSGAVLS